MMKSGSPIREKLDEKLDGMYIKKMFGINKTEHIRPGDKLAFYTGGIGTHTGIYVGNDQIVEVINISGVFGISSSKTAKMSYGASSSGAYGAAAGAMIGGRDNTGEIQCNTLDSNYLEDFTGNIGLKDAKYSREDIVERAMSRIGDRFSYDLLEDNCNHFTAWCQKGKKELDTCNIFSVEKIIYDNALLNHSDILSQITKNIPLSYSDVITKSSSLDQGLVDELCCAGDITSLCDILQQDLT